LIGPHPILEVEPRDNVTKDRATFEEAFARS
jgi:hypothetical protein